MTDFVNSVGFQEAMAYAAKRKVVLPEDYYGKLIGIQRAQSVSIAGLAALEQIRFVVDKLADVLEKGGTFKSFQDAVRDGGLDINLPTHRLENIFRTNIQAAYSRGRWEQQMRARGSRPYLMYDAINDSRTRPAHAAMDNIIRRWDDPFWATHYPTNGYRCRCTVISLTEAQAKKRGGVTDPLPDPDTTKPDPGWDYNIGADYEGGPNRAIEKTVEKIKTKRPTTSKKADEAKEKIKKATKKAGPPTLDEIMTEGQEALANMRTDPVGFNEDMEKLLMERVLGVKHGSTASNLKAIRENAREALKNLEIKAINLGRVSHTAEEYIDRFLETLPLPKKWLTMTAKRYKVRGLTLSQSRERAYADQRKAFLSIDIDRGDVMLHEFMHLVQIAVPEIETLAREMHRARTLGAPRKKLKDLTGNSGYADYEETREDKYFNPYMGKEYETNITGPSGYYEKQEPLEILTMVFQALLGDLADPRNKRGANALRNSLLSKDRESAAFGLGLLLRYA